MDGETLLGILRSRTPRIHCTHHAAKRLHERKMRLDAALSDLMGNVAYLVREQDSPFDGRRLFDAYYLQGDGRAHRYIFSINTSIRIITAMPISRRRLGP